MTSIKLTPPWNIFALINKETNLLDPRVMAAIQAALPFVSSQNGVSGLWSGTQAEYDGIPTKDPNTLYLITD
jgi:hypothetical protein